MIIIEFYVLIKTILHFVYYILIILFKEMKHLNK